MSNLSNIFVAGEPDAGLRLDSFLARQLNVSRGQIQRLLTGGGVRVDGRRESRKGVVLSAGQQIEVPDFAKAEAQQIVPRPDLPLNVLASGDGWVAVDKSAGTPVHPLEMGETETLLNAAIARYPAMQGVGEGGLRSGVVHRLDIETSGVVLLATHEVAWQRLRNEFRQHRATKIYRAIVTGRLTGHDSLILDLVVAQHSPARVKVVSADILPKPAGTRRCDLHWRAISQHKNSTLVEIKLGTGFLHQIRAMMAHIGHPVFGDKIYGAGTVEAERQMLHACSVRAANAYAESPLPADFLHILST